MAEDAKLRVFGELLSCPARATKRRKNAAHGVSRGEKWETHRPRRGEFCLLTRFRQRASFVAVARQWSLVPPPVRGWERPSDTCEGWGHFSRRRTKSPPFAPK